MNRLAPIFSALAVMGLAACSAPEPAPASASPETESESTSTTQVVQPVDIGDADQGIWLHLQLGTDTVNADVTQDIGMDQARKIYLVTAQVRGELPAVFNLDTSVYLARQFPRDPVSVRPVLTIEAEYPDGREKAVKTLPLKPLVVANQTPTVDIVEKVNLLEHLDGKPTTMLLITKAEIVLHEHGTDPNTVDPATATGPPERTGFIQSNPLRINFE